MQSFKYFKSTMIWGFSSLTVNVNVRSVGMLDCLVLLTIANNAVVVHRTSTPRKAATTILQTVKIAYRPGGTNCASIRRLPEPIGPL
jgi:hypothetical protein